MDSLTTNQQTALQIASSGNRIATPQQLAEVRLAVDANGKHIYPHYCELEQIVRVSWLGDQFFGLAILTHTSATSEMVSLDAVALDNEIMDNPILRDMTLVEMQEAFRKGAGKEYGDYFGITYASMLGFLRGYLKSEKKIRAAQIVNKRLAEAQRNANSMFFQELKEASEQGKIELPDFSKMRVNRRVKKTYTPEESAAHREKVRRQADEIMKQLKQNGTQEEPQL